MTLFELTELLRGLVCEGSSTSSGAEAIKHITAVGVGIEYVGTNKIICARDVGLLFSAVSYLQENGVTFSPDIRIDPVNICIGRNFLEERGKTDMVVACNIHAPDHPASASYIVPEGDVQEMLRVPASYKNTFLAVSASHFKDNAWFVRAGEANAKIIVTQGGQHEIGVRHFKGTGYEIVQNAHTKSTQEPDQFGYVFESEYLSELKASIVCQDDYGSSAFLKKRIIQEECASSHVPPLPPSKCEFS